MLDINLEFARGLLFIRLSGVLDNQTYPQLTSVIDDMIYEKGLKYFVINLEQLSYIDEQGQKAIIDRYFDAAFHNGKLVICGYDNTSILKLKNTFKEIEHTNNELGALKLINI